MRTLKVYLSRSIVLVVLAMSVSCATSSKQPIYLMPDFSAKSIENITLLPPIDARADKRITVNLPKQLNEKTAKILRKLGYRVVLSEDWGEAGEPVEEDLRNAAPEWIKLLGPPEGRWVMVVCLVDVITKLTFGSTGNAEILGYMFDKEAGSMIWKDKGIGQTGQGGLAGMLMKGGMDNTAISIALSDLLASVPQRK